jgi:hypothetical protein
MPAHWSTAWLGQEIVTYRNGEAVDRVAAADIERVVFVYANAGDTPGDLRYAVVELPEEHVIFPAETGFASRVHFERQSFWQGRNCIYWVSEQRARLPGRLRRGGLWFVRRATPAYLRLPRAELASLLEQWPLEGPQTWEQRKWQRIERSRPFADAAAKASAAAQGRGGAEDAKRMSA